MALNSRVNVRAVLFDYDDTIMDVNEARSYARRVITHELSLITNFDQDYILRIIKDVETRMESIGQFDRRAWFREVVNTLGINLNDNYVNELVRAYWNAWRSKSRLFPDVLPTLSDLRKCGFRLGIVTNTDGEPGLKRDRIHKDGIDELFDVIIVAGDDTAHTKPHPEPFIKALQTLNVQGNEVVYIGDRVDTDVPGAKAAGMYVGIVNRYGTMGIGVHEHGDLGLDFMIHSLLELPRLLGCM